MSSQDEIKWVAVTLDFSPEEEALIESRAKEMGLSPACVCVHAIYRRLLEDPTDAVKELCNRTFSATLERNGCPPE